MADTKISALTAGTAAGTDRIPVAISPFGSGDNRYLTPVTLGTYFAKNTLAGGTITTSQPMTLTQTWNNAGINFEGLVVDITNTASAGSSLLQNWKVGGSTVASIHRSGAFQGTFLTLGSTATSGLSHEFFQSGTVWGSAGVIAWTSAGPNGTIDLALRRDAANTLAQRNGTSAQVFNLYNTYTDGSNYERAALTWTASANRFAIGVDGAGTGSQRSLDLWGVDVNLKYGSAGGSTSATFGSSNISFRKDLIFTTDNANDIGASGATRPRSIYVGTNITVGNSILAGSDISVGLTSTLVWGGGGGRSRLASPSDGVIGLYNNASSDFSRLQFGGTTSSFPSLKRSSATLQVKLADDSAFANLDCLNLAATANITVTSQVVLRGTASGVLRLTNGAETDFSLLALGGTTSSFPALKRSSAALETKLADDSAYAQHNTAVLNAKAGTATPAGGALAVQTGTTSGFGVYYGSGAPTVSAGKGSIYLRSDGSGVNDRCYINTDGGTTWTALVTVA